MANTKITGLTEDTTPADDDLVVTVDISDTTQSPQGSTKKVQAQNLVVKKLRTSTGPTVLTLGAVADGEVLKRSGTSIVGAASTAPAAHATEHENGGSDEISVAGLSGVLADPQVADKVKESSGPTTLTVGAVADGEFLKRDGVNIVSATVAGSLADDSVTNAKLANMAQATIKGRASGAGTGDPTDLTGTQATAILDNFVGDSGSGGTKGLVPAPAGGDAAAAKFLKADGTWAAPSGTGAPADATYITQTANGSLSNEQALGSLATGIVKNTTTTGVLSIATVDDISSPVFAADAGANDTYTATLSPAPSAYVTGVHYRFKANTANTGACTINFNGLGAKTIKKVAGGITTDLADNDIRAGQWVDLVYDGTNMQMQSTLGNAASGGATINATNNVIPYRSSATAFTDSKLSFDSADSGRTFSDGYFHITRRGLAFGSFNDFGGITGNRGSVVFTNGDSSSNASNPGSAYSVFASFPTPGGVPTPWTNSGMNYRLVLTGNTTIGNPALYGGDGTAPNGYRFVIMLVQDATGGRTVTWSSDYKFPGGVAPVMTVTANAVDIYEFIVYGDIAYLLYKSQDVK